MASDNQKLKLFYLLKILKEETDAEHSLTRAQLTAKLAAYDIKVERKTFYDDIKHLQDFGCDIVAFKQGINTSYALVEREFQETELLLLADAVQSSKFLTQRKSKALIKQIGALGGKHLARELSKKIYVEGRIHNQNESVFYNLDAVHRALISGTKVSFSYFKYNAGKEAVLQHDGEPYVVTPVQLMYMDDFYYLIAFDDGHDDFTTYRLDRMRSIEVTDIEATTNSKISSFDVSKFQQRVFGMFSGEPVEVTLRVDASVMSAVVDRFGKDIESAASQDGSYAIVSAYVMKAPTFYGWLATFGTKIVIEQPESLRADYCAYLDEVRAAYEG